MPWDELYQEVVMDHYSRPRNRGELPSPDGEAELYNPFCGDIVRVQIRRDGGGKVEEIRFQGQGCSISQASASMMTEAVKGRPLPEVGRLIGDFLRFMRGEDGEASALPGDLPALGGVRQYPVRVKCATLAWHALEKALQAGSPESGEGGED
jgi:nitrogen fixation NifU-like protein